MRKGVMLVAMMAALWAGVEANDIQPQSSADEAADGVITPPFSLNDIAAPYIHLRMDIATIENTPLTSAQNTREIHRLLGSHDADDLTAAQIAYAALVAADVPAFVTAIEEKTHKRRNREKFLTDLQNNPGVVRGLDGANEAIAAIQDVFSRDATRIGMIGTSMVADSYRLQETGWGRKKLSTNGQARFQKAEKFAASREWPLFTPRQKMVTESGNRFSNLQDNPYWDANWAEVPGKPARSMGSARQIYVTNALVLAARYVTGDINQAYMDTYARHKTSDRCYTYANMYLDQCISASRTGAEETLCLGKHGLNDLSRCVGWLPGAGAAKD